MKLGDVVTGSAWKSYGMVEVEFERTDPEQVGYFSVSQLRRALDFYERECNSNGVYVKLPIATHDDSSDLDGMENLLFLAESPDDETGVVCCPRFEDEPAESSVSVDSDYTIPLPSD